MNLAIVGLGYVGLPLALQFARCGNRVLGLDIDAAKVDALNRGQSYIRHIPAENIAAAVESGTFAATTDFSTLGDVEAVVICVPTPLNKNREPDLSYILSTGAAMGSPFAFQKYGQSGLEVSEIFQQTARWHADKLCVVRSCSSLISTLS